MNHTRRICAGLFFVLATAVGAHGPAPGVAPNAAPTLPPPALSHAPDVRELTTALVNLQSTHAAAAPGQQGALLDQLVGIARQRFDALVALAAVDPSEVLRVAIPADVIAALPQPATPFVERAADETGEIEILHVDHVDTAQDYFIQTLTTAKGRFPLYVAGDLGELATGARVRVRGLWLGNALVAAAQDLVVSKASALPNTLGVQRTLVIMVNFSDAPTQPYTTTDASNVVFGTTSSYDYEASYQQTTVAGDVAGWYTIASLTTTCDYNTIASQARQAATNGGFVLSNYSRHVYVFPSNACGWWGLGSVGGNPSQAWIQTKYGFTLGVVGHEMGHNLGLYHSHSMDCGSVAIASSGCSTSDYGDTFDLMGGSRVAHFNAFQKERLGWLNAGVSPPLTTVPAQAGTVTYGIAPLEDARNTVSRALKIPRGTACSATNEWFYVEARQARGFDSFLAGNANVLGGVLIHKVTEGNANSSYLLDMTPATSAWTDAALVAGQTFVDPLTGLGITPVSVGSTGAQINVTFPAASCTRSAPKVAITPTGTVWTSAGASVNYAVNVTSQDSCGCAATTYDVSAAVPSGWSATNARTASIAPGATTATSIAVTTSSAAAAAFYTVGLNAANTAAASLIGASSGTVAIATALGVTASADKAVYTMPTRGNGAVNAVITTSVQSGGAPVSGASVSVEVRDPAGKLTTIAATTGSNGTASVTYGMRARQSPPGTYTVTSRATMGTMTGSAGTSFVVN